MNPTVLFRKFEKRDVDFIYKCKSDENLNSLVVGNFKKLSYEESVSWVDGVIRADRKDMIFWAICTNDDEKRIVGWASISEIDIPNKSAKFHGVVIGDPAYRDGFAWIETYLFIYDYAFNTLGVEKVFGNALVDHKASQTMRKLFFAETIEVKKDEVYRNGVYHDVSTGVLYKNVYNMHKSKGDYEINAIIKRLKNIRKEEKKQI